MDELNVIAKITFGGVLHVRTTEAKRGYKGPLFYAHPGDLVISKIRVAQGSLCVVPDQFDHLAVSAEYPVYTVDPAKVSAEFIRMVIRTTAFKHRVGRLRSGNTTKARVRPTEFEELTIPLPPLEQQRSLLDDYHKAMLNAEKLASEAAVIEQASQQAFEEALGVAPPPPLPDRPVFIARFKEVERWSHEGVLRATVGDKAVEVSKCPMVELQSIATVSYGIQKSPANRPGTHARPYMRVANVQRGRLVLDEIKTINVPDVDMPALRLAKGDILFVEGNGSRMELGRVALWGGEIEDCVHQNHIIKARPDQSKLLPEFAMAWFNCDAGREHFFKAGKTTSGLGTINSTVVKTAPVPLPKLEHQRQILEEVKANAERVDAKRSEAESLRLAAWSAFESALFESQEKVS